MDRNIRAARSTARKNVRWWTSERLRDADDRGSVYQLIEGSFTNGERKGCGAQCDGEEKMSKMGHPRVYDTENGSGKSQIKEGGW